MNICMQQKRSIILEKKNRNIIKHKRLTKNTKINELLTAASKYMISLNSK